MTRPIKFRAWDKERREYLSGGHVLLAIPQGRGERHTTLFLDLFEGDGDRYKDRFDIEQFTGLTDKNGREIYEGDILNEKHDKAAPGGGHICGTYAFHPENALVVEWSEASAKFTVDHGAEGLAKTLSWRKRWGGLEVIGNIRENPEILK